MVLALKLPNEDLKILSNSIVSRLPKEEPKQETLEEFIKQSNTPEGLDQFSYDKGLEDGAKWQSKRMYSEKEVESLLHKFMQSQHPDWHGYSTTKWFEQNKKK